MKRSEGIKNRKKPKTPPLRQNPKFFEMAFEERLRQSPVNYLIGKIQSESSISAIEYLFNIISVEIARKNNCLYKGFAYYHTMAEERLREMRKHIVYNKLVRDNIPGIIEASGKTCVTEGLPNDAYIQALEAKLNEELAEYQQSKSLEELADLLEVMGAVVKARGYTWDDLTRVRREKRAHRGGYDKRIFLKEVIE